MYLHVTYRNNMFQKTKQNKIPESNAVDSQHKKVMDLARGSLKRANKLITELEHLSYEREADRVLVVQTEEEKALRRPQRSLPALKGA